MTYFISSHMQPLDEKTKQEEAAFIVNEKLSPSCMTLESFQVSFNCIMVTGAS